MSEPCFLKGQTRAHLKARDGFYPPTVRTLCGKLGLPGEPVQDAANCRECKRKEKHEEA